MTPLPLSAPLTLAQALAMALQPHATQAFGLMGNGNAHFINALADVGIAHTEVRHEVATVAAADAYTRIANRLSIATTTYGAGFTNTLTALAEAAQARTPMLVVVGDTPAAGPRPWDVDQEMLAAAVGVRTYVLTAEDPTRTVNRAVESSLRHRRPVIISIPYDLVNTTVERAQQPAFTPQNVDLADPEVISTLLKATLPLTTTAHSLNTPEADHFHDGATRLKTTEPLDTTSIAQAVAAIRRGQRTVIIAGRGAVLADAAAELDRLANCTGALTASTALARGIFGESRYDLGITGGFGQDAAMSQLAQADTVVVVGASLNQFTMRFGELFAPNCKVIRIDTDEVAPPRTMHAIDHLLLRGDATQLLRAINEALLLMPPQHVGWRDSVTGLEPGGALRVRPGSTNTATATCADGRLDPRAVALRIGESLPQNRYVTSDGGHFIGWANMYWPVTEPQRMVMVGTAYQSIGLGFSTVAGVAAAAPGATVVLTTGDGGGLMALADLETAIRTTTSCIIVVWNDGAYGAEVHLYGRMGLDEAPMRIPDVNFAGIATALGATGVTVQSMADLDALDTWREAGATGTILLDCRISRSIVAPYQEEILKANGVK